MKYEVTTKTKLKLAVTVPIVRALFHTLPYISDKFAIKLMRKFFGENSYKPGQEFIERAFGSLKKIFKTANPNCKRAIINNMIINEGIIGQQVRRVVTKEIGFEIPVLIASSPTQRCPLKCYGCYSAEYTKDEDLDFDVYDKMVTDAKEMGIYFIVITGGEPYVYKHLFELFEKHSDVYFQTYTSGITLAEKDHVERLAKLGNVLPCISLEGFEEETDKRRGKGHYKRVLKAMEKLNKAGVPFGFSATATRENNDMLLSDEFINFYEKKGAAVGYYFQYMPIGREPVFDLVPTPKQRMYRYERILELRREKPILLADFWCDGPLVGGCMAGGRRYLHVNNLGHVEPCVFAQAYDMSLYDHSLLEVLKTSKFFKAIRRRQPYSENLMRPCMIIDVPECWRDAIAESGAKLSYETAGDVVKHLKDDIENFSREYAELTNPVWEKKYKKIYERPNAHVKSMRKVFGGAASR